MEVLPSGHRLKVPVCIRPDYEILYENLEGLIFVHSTVRRWTHRVRQAFLADIARLHALIGCTVYARSDFSDVKHQKFLALCGFREAGRNCYAADGHLMLGFELTRQE